MKGRSIIRLQGTRPACVFDDDNSFNMIAEGEVLVPIIPAVKRSEDDWPEFALSKVKICVQGTNELTSLLSANEEHPVRVEGVLEHVEDWATHLKHDPNDHRNARIVIDDVTTYAYAQYDDNSFGFWAAGNAGWFEIKSCLGHYRKVFEDMVEATEIFYFLADTFDPKLQWRKVAKAFYDANLMRPYKGVPDVVESFHKHRIFLLTSMCEGQGDKHWDQSTVFSHLKNKFPADYQSIRQRTKPADRKDGAAISNAENSSISLAKNKKPSNSRSKPPPKAQKPKPRTPKTKTVSSDEESEDTGPESNKNPLKRKTTSILKPKSSKSSKKSAGSTTKTVSKLSKGLSSDEDPAEEVLTLGQGSPTPGMSSSAPNSLNLLGVPTEIKTTKSERQQRGPPHTHVVDTLPLKRHRLPPELRANVYITEHDLDDNEPQISDNVWECKVNGCKCKIYEMGEPYAKKMVEEHKKTHSNGAQEKLDLVNAESRPYLPVSHLIERIKEICRDAPAAPAAPAASDSEEDFPPSIKRRF